MGNIRRVIGLRASVAAFVVLVVSLAGFATANERPQPGPDPDSPATRKELAEARAREAVWEAKRKTPPAEVEREASQLAFSDQSSAEALTTAQAKFPGWLTEPVFTGPPLADGQELADYMGDHQARIDGPGERRTALFSTLPLIGRTPDGERAPVDLRLTEAEGGLSPRSSAAPVVLPNRSAGRVRFPKGGFSVRLDGARDDAGELTHDRLFFANVTGREADLDAMIQPAQRGAEISYLLRSAKSPSDQVLKFGLPESAHLSLSGKRGQQLVTIVGADDKPLGLVLPPAAVDAQGAPVRSSYSLDGPDRLVFHVAHRDERYAYPVLADPLVAYWDPGMYNAWTWGANVGGVFSPGVNNNYTETRGPTVGGQGGPGQFADWAYWSLAGAYIYKMFSNSTWHYPNNSVEFGGINNGVGNWELGSWQDTVPSGGSGPGGSGGPYASRQQSAQESYVDTTYCARGSAASCTPPPRGLVVTPNVAVTAGLVLNAPIGYPGWIPQSDVYGDYLYESDDQIPTLATPTHTGLPTGWAQSFTDTVGLSASVPTGLGMSSITMFGPIFRSSSTSCPSYPCPLSHSASFTYSSGSLSEGISKFSAKATNAAGNESSPRTWDAKVDRSAPTTTVSGTAWNAPNDTLLPGSHTINVNATDGVFGGPLSQQRSGVKEIGIRIRRADRPVETHPFTQVHLKEQDCDTPANPKDSCPLSTSYVLDTDDWADPSQATTPIIVEITTPDRVPGTPNVKTDPKTLTIASADKLAEQTIGLIPPGPWSGSCGSPLATVSDGYAGDVYVRMRVQPDPTDPKTTWVCYRGSNGSSLELGGRLDLTAAGTSGDPPSFDEASGRCASEPGNAVPPPHPLVAGELGDPQEPPHLSFSVDSYATEGAGWVCLEVGDFKRRAAISVPGASAPAVASHIDSPAPALPDSTPPPAGYPSGTCQSGLAGTPQRYLNADLGTAHVWAYSAQPSQSKVHVCARLEGPVSAGGMVTLDASNSPGVTPVIETSSDTSPCTTSVASIDNPVSAGVSRSPTGSNPASVCVRAGSTQQRITVGTQGSPTPPQVTWSPDPGTPG